MLIRYFNNWKNVICNMINFVWWRNSTAFLHYSWILWIMLSYTVTSYKYKPPTTPVIQKQSAIIQFWYSAICWFGTQYRIERKLVVFKRNHCFNLFFNAHILFEFIQKEKYKCTILLHLVWKNRSLVVKYAMIIMVAYNYHAQRP